MHAGNFETVMTSIDYSVLNIYVECFHGTRKIVIIYQIYIYVTTSNRYTRILFGIFISYTTWHGLHFNCHIAEFASLRHFHQWFKRIFNFLLSKYQLKVHNYTATPVKVHNAKVRHTFARS